MKKKILFVMESLGIGGAEKSLVTILSLLDYNKYDVDLQLFRDNGEFMGLLPKEVNVLPSDSKIEIFQKDFKTAWLRYLLKGNLVCSYHSLCWFIGCFFSRYVKKKEYVGWKHVKHLMNVLPDKYDTAIGFLEKKSIYYCVDKVIADKKIGFIHNDYQRIEHDEKKDRKYFEKLDAIPTVSEHCKIVLDKCFPEQKEKIHVIKNMVAPQVIQQMSKENAGLKKEEYTIYICTVGRLVEQKGIDIAIKVCKKLVDAGFKIKWFVCGEGSERKNLEELMSKYNLKENFILLGAQTNPYKYMEVCDIYVQPSRYEGYGITVAEAKVLGKPIVANNIPEFQEQIIDGETGLLYEGEEDCINKIISLIENSTLRDNLVTNLRNDSKDTNIEELHKLESIL